MNAEMKKSLDGQLPQTNHPVCVEIQMETSEVRKGGKGGKEGWNGRKEEGRKWWREGGREERNRVWN